MGLFKLDSLGPQHYIHITPMIYSQVIAATFDEGISRNGLYLTTDQEIQSLQTVALMLPAGMSWNIPKLMESKNGTPNQE